MHNIQRKILIKLLYAESLGYTQMRPEGVESNHFAYHLDQLVCSGLVAKQEKRYSLTVQGLALVDRLSQEKMVDRLQPHIVTAISLTNTTGETLLFKRNFQPYFHRVGLPLGKIHYEETITEAAERELQEKCGLTRIPLQHRGMVYIEAKQQGITISKVLYHIFEGTSDQQPENPDPKRGVSFWAAADSFSEHELMPGFQEIKRLLATPSPLFFAEIFADLI